MHLFCNLRLFLANSLYVFLMYAFFAITLQFMHEASVTGTYIFTKMEAVGEGVADLLGLNDR